MEFLPEVLNAAKQWGWLGGLGAALSVLVALYRRWVDPLMPTKAKWSLLPKWGRVAIIFACAAAGAALVAVGQGTSVWVAVQLAMSTGLSAIGFHQAASAVFPGQKEPSLPAG